jgi:hypothetical protein
MERLKRVIELAKGFLEGFDFNTITRRVDKWLKGKNKDATEGQKRKIRGVGLIVSGVVRNIHDNILLVVEVLEPVQWNPNNVDSFEFEVARKDGETLVNKLQKKYRVKGLISIKG